MYQRTTTFRQFLLRVVGVVGGVWVCAGWAFKIGGKAIEVAAGLKKDEGLLTEANSTSRKSRWTGGSLTMRKVTNEKTWEENMSPGWMPAPTTPFAPYSQPVSSPSTGNVRPPSPFVAASNGSLEDQSANGATPKFVPSPFPGSTASLGVPSSSLPPAPSPFSPSHHRSASTSSIIYQPGRVSPSPAHPSFRTHSRMSSLNPNRVSFHGPVTSDPPPLPVDGNEP